MAPLTAVAPEVEDTVLLNHWYEVITPDTVLAVTDKAEAVAFKQ